MKRILSILGIIGLVAALTLAAEMLYFYKGVYAAPPTSFYDTNITISTIAPSTFLDRFDKRNGTVLLDKAHDNNFIDAELDVLLHRILLRGNAVEFLDNQSDLKERLANANSFIIISPQEEFSKEEIRQIEAFVEEGGKLLLITDPERENVLRALSINFGLLPQQSYLYNLKENDGNFRYIFVTDFIDHELTKNLSRIVLYGACPILPSENGLMFTDSNTFASTKDLPERFTPMVLTNTVAALCDQTFLTEPYNSFGDNNQLISNIADWLTNSTKAMKEVHITNATS